jgi:tRNA dimethylallyltransferase
MRAPERLLALVGPTATGKSEAGVILAERLGAEILSVDSMTVYRGMDVGTAKPGPAERARVRHHLVDVAGPTERFSVAAYQTLAREALSLIAARGRRALLVGGTGLYFRAVVDDLAFPRTDPSTRLVLEREAAAVGARALHDRLRSFDPAAAERIEPNNVRRTVRALEVAAVTGRPFSSFGADWERFGEEGVRAAGVEMKSADLYARIERRARAQIDEGLVDEVRRLLAEGAGPSLTARQAIGYAEVIGHLEGEVSLEEAVRGTVRRSRALARRQMAWFRRDPRIRWFRAGPDGAAGIIDEVAEYLGDG